MSRMTLNLPDELAARLAAASRETMTEPEALACEMIERSLWLREFDKTRAEMIAALGTAGTANDEEAFSQVSANRKPT